MLLICTNDNRYLSKLKSKLDGMDIITVDKLSDDNVNDIDFVIVDCFLLMLISTKPLSVLS